LKDQARIHQGQDVNAHPLGFGTPLGALKNGTRLSTVNSVAALGLKAGESATLEFKSGVVVTGTFVKTQSSHAGQLQIITWENCTVTLDGKVLFDPSWGTFDMAVGESVVQVKM
jgi:phenylalanine-4-hydroxylase